MTCPEILLVFSWLEWVWGPSLYEQTSWNRARQWTAPKLPLELTGVCSSHRSKTIERALKSFAMFRGNAIHFLWIGSATISAGAICTLPKQGTLLQHAWNYNRTAAVYVISWVECELLLRDPNLAVGSVTSYTRGVSPIIHCSLCKSFLGLYQLHPNSYWCNSTLIQCILQRRSPSMLHGIMRDQRIMKSKRLLLNS